MVSSYHIITDFLDHLEAHGLQDSIEELDTDSKSSANDSGSLENDDDPESKKKVPVAMWEDDVHLSKAANKAFADRLWEALRE